MVSCSNVTLPTNGSDENAPDMTLSWVINQVTLPGVCVFGIVGNTLNLAILTRQKLTKSFRTLEQSANLCLISLALSDLMFCIFAFLTMFLPADNIYDEGGLLLAYGVYSNAIINVFIMESTLLTVAMSLERYLAICFPLRQDIYLNTRRIKFVIVFTVLFSIGFNIPVLWRNEVVVLCAPNNAVSDHNVTLPDVNSAAGGLTLATRPQILRSGTNTLTLLNSIDVLGTLSNDSFQSLSSNIHGRSNKSVSDVSSSSLLTSQQPSLEPAKFPSSLHSQEMTYSNLHTSKSRSLSTKMASFNPKSKTLYTTRIVPLGGSSVYDTAYRVVWAFLGNFIPLVLLFYFNVCLCRKIYRSYKLRKELGRHGLARSSSHVLTVTLVAIVALFFILVAPSEVTLQISHVTNTNNNPTYKNTEAVLNLMQSINFSVNFILYCIISPDFRKTLRHFIHCDPCEVARVSRDWSKKFQTSFM